MNFFRGITRYSTWIVQSMSAERDRWILWTPVFLGAGISVYFSLTVEPAVWVGMAVLVVSVASAWLSRSLAVLLLISLGVAIAAAGFSAAQLRTYTSDHPVIERETGPLSVSGRIVRVEPFPDGARLTLDRLTIGSLRPDRVPPTVRVRLRGHQPPLVPGNWVRLRAALSPPPPPVFPGGFDLQRQFYFQGIGGVGFSFGAAELVASGDAQLTLGARIERLRLLLSDRIRQRIGGGAGAVAAALLTGMRTQIPEPVLEAFRQAGLAHLLAISGLHIGLVAGFVFLSLRAALSLIPAFALAYPIKKWAAVVAVAAAFGYAVIAGATVPTQRAFLMIALVLLAVVIDRQGISMRMVAWAALIILALRPESLLGASFQMSFAAVVALIAVYEVWTARTRLLSDAATWWRRPVIYFASVVVTTLVASAATAPFVIYHFNRVALFGLAANMIAVPLTAFWIMPVAVLAFVAMPFGFDGPLLDLMGQGVSLVVGAATTVSGWQGSSVGIPAVPFAGVGAMVLGGLWLALWRQRLRWLGLPVVTAGVLFFMVHSSGPDIIVSGDGGLFAVRTADGGYALSTRRRARFAGENWLQRAGLSVEERRTWPRTGYSDDGKLSCDGVGCIYRKEQAQIALVSDPLALLEDCRRVKVIIASVPVSDRRCPSAHMVIDRFDLWRNGAHAVWVTKTDVRIKSVNGERGRRPWVIAPQ